MNENYVMSAIEAREHSRYFGEKVLDTYSWMIGYELNSEILSASIQGKKELDICLPVEWTMTNSCELYKYLKDKGYKVLRKYIDNELINNVLTISWENE